VTSNGQEAQTSSPDSVMAPLRKRAEPWRLPAGNPPLRAGVVVMPYGEVGTMPDTSGGTGLG